jgi:hypothetical protein
MGILMACLMVCSPLTGEVRLEVCMGLRLKVASIAPGRRVFCEELRTV